MTAKVKNLLHISPNFDYPCGVSKHVYISLKNLASDPNYNVFFITNKGDSLDRLAEIANLNLSLLNFEKDHKDIFKLINDFFILFKFCKKNRIDVIHTHHRYPELLAFLVSLFIDIKTITTVHSFVKGLNRISFRSHKIIAVSNAVNEYLKKKYVHTKSNCITLQNCLEENFFTTDEIDRIEIKKYFGYDLNDRILLFVGRINKIKGVDVLIKAFKTLPRELNIKLLLVGSITKEFLKELLFAKSEGIQHIESQSDIKKFYILADVVVLPSREDPFPYVMLEAGAMRKPFIGSRTGGISEFIKDGVDGFLFEPENVDELVSKIIYVFNNPDLSQAASVKLFSKVKENYNCKSYFENLNRIYIDLLNQSKG